MVDQEHLPKAEAVENIVESPEHSPAEVAEALQERLDDLVESNNNLEAQVDGTVREAAMDYAVDHPEAVAADTAVTLENLPKNDGVNLNEAAAAAKDMLVKVEQLPGAKAAEGMVSKFLQERYGGSLADVAKAAADMLMPGTGVIKAVMKGELPKGKDVGRLASAMVAPPLGTVVFDLIAGRSAGSTPAEVKRAAIQGRLGADLIKAVGWFLPEAAVATTPAAEVMRNVANQTEKAAAKPDSSTADRAKAFARGILADKGNLKALGEALGVKMTTDSALEAAGIKGDSAETVKAIGKMISEDPDRAMQSMLRVFGDGGIVEEPANGTPAGAIEMNAAA
jgi:hypothetical protein